MKNILKLILTLLFFNFFLTIYSQPKKKGPNACLLSSQKPIWEPEYTLGIA
jgi:hypothetical protein